MLYTHFDEWVLTVPLCDVKPVYGHVLSSRISCEKSFGICEALTSTLVAIELFNSQQLGGIISFNATKSNEPSIRKKITPFQHISSQITWNFSTLPNQRLGNSLSLKTMTSHYFQISDQKYRTLSQLLGKVPAFIRP